MLKAFYDLRFNAIKKLKETKNPNPYPHKFHVSQSIPSYVREYAPEGKIDKGQTLDGAKPVISLPLEEGIS